MEEIQGKHQEAITDRDNQIQAFEFTNEEHQQKMLGLNEEINDLIAKQARSQLWMFWQRAVFYPKQQQRSSPMLHYLMSVQEAWKTSAMA